MKNILLVLMAITSLQIHAKEVTYVGGGRYTCRGSDCGEFNREQGQRNHEQETRERYRHEEREESQRIEDEIRRGNEIMENQE